LEQTVVTISLVDTTAKSDSTPFTTDIQFFTSASQLKNDIFYTPKYATLEDNFFLLDGSCTLMPAGTLMCGYWSESISGSSGTFTTSPVITISFTALHSSSAITLHFLDDAPSSVTLQWYDLSSTLLSSGTYVPDSLDYVCENAVENYGKLVITFNSTASPYRYIKLRSIDYGPCLIYSNDEVMAASIVEEVDLISNSISINTFGFTLYSPDDAFNPYNPAGLYSMFQQGQAITAYKVVNSVTTLMGAFHLETWESEDDSTGVFTSNDSIGVLDKTNFKLGQIYSSATAGSIIDAIMASAGWTDYTVDSTISAVTLSGWIAICTHREALQQVAFAAGAIVDDSRGNTIRIYAQPSASGLTIPTSRKFSGGSVKLLTYTSGISVTAHEYALNTDTVQLYSATLNIGTHTITFDTAVTSLAITGGTITESHPNYAVISVTTAGAVVLTGQKYEDHTSTYGVTTSTLPAGATENIEEFTSATLISSSNALTIATRIYNYYQLRYLSEISIDLGDESVGTTVSLQRSDESGYTTETIEKMTIDLVGGLVADTTFIGSGAVT
jgi:hypothetical protein